MYSFSSIRTIKLTGAAPAFFRMTQRRWAQVHDARFRFLATQRDRYLEKYKDKIEKKIQEHHVRNSQELKELYKDKIEALRKESAISIPFPSISPTSKTSNPQDAASPLSLPPSSRNSAIKTLSAYLDVEKVRGLPTREIETLWRLRNVNNPLSLCAVIPLPLYQKMESMARRYSSFILPLPRENQGAEIHYLQWAFPSKDVATVLFTHLAEYKLRGEFSQPHMTVSHHLELAEEKKIILLRGEVMDGRGVSVDEAKWLLLCLQRFYGGLGDDETSVKRRGFIEMFGSGDVKFNVEELVREAEKIV